VCCSGALVTRQILVGRNSDFHRGGVSIRHRLALLTLDGEDARELADDWSRPFLMPRRSSWSRAESGSRSMSSRPDIICRSVNSATELFLSAGCIWHVCQGRLRIVDLIAPVEQTDLNFVFAAIQSSLRCLRPVRALRWLTATDDDGSTVIPNRHTGHGSRICGARGRASHSDRA
jgi:hypothetical protein